jgi:ankyrin repeat protein
MTQVSEVDRIKLFHQVAFIGNATLLSSLLKEGVNVNAEINNRTALHIASGQGNGTTQRKLNLFLKLDFCSSFWAKVQIHYKFQISTHQFPQSQSVVFQSRKCLGHEECVELLVNNGAKIDVFDENGQTPLHWAVKNGHAHIVKLLLKYGASIDVVIYF